MRGDCSQLGRVAPAPQVVIKSMSERLKRSSRLAHRRCQQVFEYMETDLENVIKDRSRVLSAADVKAYMQMVLRALALCHANWIVHRDVKPNNFLVSAAGELKLADFGLARLYGSPERKYTNQVCRSGGLT